MLNSYSIVNACFAILECMGMRTSSIAITTSTVSRLSRPRSLVKCELAESYGALSEGRAPQLVVRSRRRSGEERATRCRAVIVATAGTEAQMVSSSSRDGVDAG